MPFRAPAIAAFLFVTLAGVTAAPAAPAASSGPLVADAAMFAQWHQPGRRHVGPRHRRCWWEHRRVRDHRGRWVTRRVQVCR